MNFSLLIPTRRPEVLEALLESIDTTTKFKSLIEIRFAVDNDDNLTREKLEELRIKFSKLKILIFSRPRGNSLVTHYFNWLAKSAIGQYLIILTDDSLFMTKDWDEIVLQEFKEFLKDKPDGLVCGIPTDCVNPINNPRHKVNFPCSCFPILSKKGVETIGFFLDPYYLGPESDADVCKLYFDLERSIDLRRLITIQNRNVTFVKFFDNSSKCVEFVERAKMNTEKRLLKIKKRMDFFINEEF